MHTKKNNIYIYDEATRPIGIVLIIPGMFEHIRQYRRFVRFLNQNRYIVCGIEITHDEFQTIATRAKRVIDDLKSKYNLPVFVFGHGYGGFVARRLLMMKNLCSGGVCLSGIAKYPNALLSMARMILKIGIRAFGPGTRIRTRHQNEYSYEFYYSLIDNIMNLSTRVPTNIPLLIINGGRGINARMTTALYNNYRENELHNLTLILYPDASNNLVLGDMGADVQKDILDFLNSVQK